MFKNVIKEQLKVPAHIDYLSELRDFVTRVGKKHGVSDKIINAFKLAIDEAGTNIIRHAYREFSEPGFILLRVIVRKASITISLIDQGKYFDPKEVKNPDLKRYVEIGKKGGLGIFIIRKLMDDIDYRRTEEGNELRLTKYRDEDRSDGVKALPQKVKTIPLSLKAKYFIRTALIITFIVAGAYGYFYYKVSVTTQKKYFAQLMRVGNQAFSELMTDERNFQIENLHHLFATVFDLYKKYNKDVYEFLVVDRKGLVTVTSDTTSILSENERIIGQKIEVKQNIFQYAFVKEGGKQSKTPVAVYDYVLPIVLSGNKTPWGDLHVRMLQAKVQQEILRQRWEYARFALSILLFSYAGAILLIYLLLNPFRKLADWIRALDHGEVQDEMDIDSSTEIGEIAKAFSEITTKFRESQKHLAEQEQLQKEMQVAQEIQQTLLPTEFPEIEGYEIASYYEAAKEVGGDYFDFVEVDKDTMGIVVADVSGKGVPGSLVMTMIRTALRTEARGVKDAAEVLARVNDFVVDDMK
ncbi:MAG: HAMP domain-containing protein, partial [Calditrichaeota bacterium]